MSVFRSSGCLEEWGAMECFVPCLRLSFSAFRVPLHQTLCYSTVPVWSEPVARSAPHRYCTSANESEKVNQREISVSL